MKTLIVIAVSVTFLFAACGGQPEDVISSAMDVLPDEAMFSIAIKNPEAIITSLDGYAGGVPVLGETAISGWILSAMDCADMSEVEAKLGIDVNGELVIYMQSMMPQSIGAALSVTNPDTFWTNIGVVPQVGEPLDGYDVSTINAQFGNLYFCNTNGLLLGAGSRAGLQAMLERLDGSLPESLPGIPDGSMYLYADIASFGPMAASQLAMVKPQLLAEMSDDGADPEFARQILSIYFDMITLVLTETESVSFVMSFEPEYITCTSTTEFVPGSSLDQFIVPAEVEDLTGLVPAGNVAVARISIDPATSEAAMNAIFGALGITDVPQNMVSFWAECSRNTAMSMILDPDNPMHIIAVYQMPQGAALEEVYESYSAQFEMMSGFMEMPGVTLSDLAYEDIDGQRWLTFGMNMDMAAFQPDLEDDVPMTESFGWKAWLTISDGMLYLEMAEQPEIVPELIAGTWQGETAASMPQMQNFSRSSEMAMIINIPEYVNMAMSMSGLDIPRIESEPVWFELEVDFTDEGVTKYFRVSGVGLTAFIGEAIGTFGAMSQ